MPRRSEPRGADEILSKIASTLARSATPEDALAGFNSALSESVPGLKTWIFHLRADGERCGGAWIPGGHPPPFLPSVALDPRSATTCVTLSPSVIEIDEDSVNSTF